MLHMSVTISVRPRMPVNDLRDTGLQGLRRTPLQKGTEVGLLTMASRAMHKRGRRC